MEENKEYFAYLRESINLDSGIKIQKEKIEKFCSYSGKIISKWFIDNDKSAYKYRPHYERMMEELKQSNVSGLICTSLTRFGRNTVEVLMDYKNIVDTQKKELILIDNNIDSGTTTGKAMLGMLAVFADWERDTIKERLAGGREYASRKGTKSGLPMNRPPVSIDWKEFDEFREQGASIAFICKKIVDSRTGKKISKSALYKAVKQRGLSTTYISV